MSSADTDAEPGDTPVPAEITDATRAAHSFQELEELFHAALELEGQQRASWLAKLRDERPDMARELAALLDADEVEGEADLLTAGAAGLAADLPGVAARPERVGPYRLLDPLGEGGMGQVFLAQRDDGAFDRKVAVKFLHSGLLIGDLLARFEAERRTLARLEHPGIARLLDAGTTPESGPYFVLEYVDGVRLDQFAEQEQLLLEGRVQLWSQVIEAVAYAHERLVVHRDLKPSNILVEYDGTARLLDFGIAKVLEDDQDVELTRTGERALTPAYASPEQIRGEEVTPRADVYALGVVGYELFSGRRAYGSRTSKRHELERAVLESTPRSLRGQVPADVDSILQRCLSKDPARRYASAGELLQDLNRFRSGHPVQARPDSLAYRSRLWIKRKPIEASLIAALVVGSIVGAVLFVDGSLEEQRLLKDVARLVDVKTFDRLTSELHSFKAHDETQIEAQEVWIKEVDRLLEGEAGYAALEAQLEQRIAAGWSGSQAAFAEDFWIPELKRYLVGLEELRGEDPYGETLARVQWFNQESETLRQRSLGDYLEPWRSASQTVADPGGIYGGLELSPQLGLVPLGVDASSGLWEFWHVQSGVRPERSADGRQWDMTGDAGLVMVLIPAGQYWIGAQADDPDVPNFDPFLKSYLADQESPVLQADLGAYFISKYEMTQGQWQRLAGYNPSDYAADSNRVVGGHRFDWNNPVEQVSWEEAMRVLPRWGLLLPTEAQWEAAARARTQTAFWTGEDVESTEGAINMADAYAKANGGPGWGYELWLEDGHTVHAPVGSYAPNAFGLHEVLGNLWEWNRDAFKKPSSRRLPRPGDGLRGEPIVDLDWPPDVVAKGGAYSNPHYDQRHGRRYETKGRLTSRTTGIRASRQLDP